MDLQLCRKVRLQVVVLFLCFGHLLLSPQDFACPRSTHLLLSPQDFACPRSTQLRQDAFQLSASHTDFAGVQKTLLPPGSEQRAGLATRHAAHTASVLSSFLISKQMLAVTSGAVVASLFLAVLSAIFDPIINRVLVYRMPLRDALKDLRLSSPKCFFETSLLTQLLTLPIFEMILCLTACASLLPGLSATAKVLLIGGIFSTVTLPIVNWRYNLSLRLHARKIYALPTPPAGNFQAYLPTLVRDTVYAAARISLPAMVLAHYAHARRLIPATILANSHVSWLLPPRIVASSPQVLFGSVLGAALLAGPVNELRGFALQSGRKLSLGEFFSCGRLCRSLVFTVIRSLMQAFSLVAGYRFVPKAIQFLGSQGALPVEHRLWLGAAGAAALVLLLSLSLQPAARRSLQPPWSRRAGHSGRMNEWLLMR